MTIRTGEVFHEGRAVFAKDEVGMLEVRGPLGRSVGSLGTRNRSKVKIRKDRVIFQKISKSR